MKPAKCDFANATRILGDLAQRGFRAYRDGVDIVVEPGSKLQAADRRLIRKHKLEIWAALLHMENRARATTH